MLSEIFKAYDIRGVYPDPLNAPAARRIGYGTGRFLLEQTSDGAGPVLVGRDMRVSSPDLADALIAGLNAAGLAVVDVGMCDTSMIYFAVNHLGTIGGVMVTASHNPPKYNGFKISGPLARPIGSQTGLDQIQAYAESAEAGAASASAPRVSQEDIWDAYRSHILGFLPPLARPLRAFIDASNGMAGEVVPRVFDRVEGLTILPLNFEITGSFVHEPNPLVPENMVPTQEGVLATKADLGVCFDGDADRCMVVDDQGKTIGCDHLTALLADHFVARQPGATVFYDLRSSRVVRQTVERAGGTARRSRVGHVFMKAAMRECNGLFGGELSGHFYFRDNFFADSGAITFAVVLHVLSGATKSVSELVQPYRVYPQSGELNFEVDDKAAVMNALKQRYADDAEVDELDGVTIDAFEGAGFWFNVRPSNTEPLLRLNAEAKDEPTLNSLMEALVPDLGDPVTSGH